MEARNYSYKDFIKLLNSIYDEKPTEVDWVVFTQAVISEISDKLFELQSNEQRKGFLMNVFRNFFNNGKDYNFYQIHLTEQNNLLDETHVFIYECLLSIRSIILEISEESLNYDLDFKEIMINSIRTGGVPYYFVPFIFKDSQTEDNYTHIFNSEQGYKIFKAWREFTNDDTKIINFEFIYHQLSYDNYLVDDLKPSVFLNYLQSIDIPRFGKIQSKEKIQFNGKRCEKFKTDYYKIKSIS